MTDHSQSKPEMSEGCGQAQFVQICDLLAKILQFKVFYCILADY